MSKKQFWIWVDGKKRYYDYPAEPPGYTLEQLEHIYILELLAKNAEPKREGDTVPPETR